MKELILCVHGTFANSENSTGNQWWQSNSPFWDQMTQDLNGSIPMQPNEHVFKWDGKNSERSRLLAAKELFKRIHEYEKKDISYHLVGHSHGGSVIIKALELAEQQNVRLNKLKSWSTVGTPFITYQPSASISRQRLELVIFVALLVSLIFTAYLIATEKFLSLLGITSLTLWGTLGLISVGFLSSLLGNNDVKHEVKAEEKLRKSVMHNYGKRWLGIFSQEDEAINGLLRSLENIDIPTPSMTTYNRNIIFPSDRRKIVATILIPFHWVPRILAPYIFNKLLANCARKRINTTLKKIAHGNDRNYASVTSISPSPFIHKTNFEIKSLPENIELELTSSANNALQVALPQLRKTIKFSKTVNTVEFSKAFSSKELIHTSYFDNQKIRGLLLFHITKNSKQETIEITSLECLEWFKGL